MRFIKVFNDSSGCLRVNWGTTPTPFMIGDQIFIKGEKKVRVVTYISQGRLGQHLHFKGQGSIPLGEVKFKVCGG